MKSTKVLSLAALAAVAGIATFGASSAAGVATPTTLGITTGTLTFYKDLTGGNTSPTIDIGTYAASLDAIAAASAGNHKFVINDMVGASFTVTLQSSALVAANGSIPAANIGYTGTTWTGTGKPLTADSTGAVDIGTSPVTFVARTNNLGLSNFNQDITIKVAVPAAQAPGSYAGTLTFTY